jgi:hypothetical protein
MNDYRNYAYAKLNIEFDRELFCKEYDQYIFPFTKHVPIFESLWKHSRDLNQAWGMVDPISYDQIDINTEPDVYKKPSKILQRGIRSFQSVQLLKLLTNDSDSEYVKQNFGADGSLMRNHHLNRTWELKSPFRNLKITKFIFENLPFNKITNIRCVSLEPGSFFCIHRDIRFSSTVDLGFDKNNGLNNGLYRQGYVTIILNISDGGVPLYWSLDGMDKTKPSLINDTVYMHSDYFIHGVPICKTRRRQIRITGTPSSELMNLIDHNNKVVLPEDYEFDQEHVLYDQ